MQIARCGVALGVRRKAGLEKAAEVRAGGGVQFVVEFNRVRAAFNGREGAPHKGEDMGIRAEVGIARWTTGIDRAQSLKRSSGADDAISIPFGLSITEPDTMQHTFAHELVVRRCDVTE